MPFFVLHGLDGANGPEIRKATRQAHLDFLKSLGERYKAGSALLADDGVTQTGSLVVIEAKDLKDARMTFAQDPYMKANLWDRIDVRQMAQWNPK
jgi:uncharacterized protein YciI